MKKKVFRLTLAALLAMVLLTSVLAAWSVYDASRRELAARNLADARALQKSLDAGAGIQALQDAYASAGARVTLIGADGTVLADSEADAALMENHGDRAEFLAAVRDGTGEASRLSATLSEESLYCAAKLADGRVVRVARAQRTVMGLLVSMRGLLALSVVAAAVIAVAIARFAAKALTKPLENLDLERPEDNDCYEELSPLLRRLGAQQRELSSRLDAEKRRTRRIEAITGAMEEGLAVLDGGLRVLLLNDSARRLLSVPDSVGVGSHLLVVNRSAEMAALAEAAKAGRAASGVLRVGGRALEARISPVHGDDGRPQGYVLLATDVTARLDAERMRREFSANVSHEMMTPLTSISGYAELIASGMAKPEDVAGFADRILKESRRMAALVEDTMRLSRLDEGNVREKWEDVRLLALAREAAEALGDKAKGLNVALSIQGEEATVRVVRQLAWEILYNLTDNAVKYNRPGGSVTVTVDANGFTVADTGIGIPKDQQDKVFERFYRVDKSHSRQTGGTGLGLSIARHAAEYLGARIALTSAEGEGTTVRVTFAE